MKTLRAAALTFTAVCLSAAFADLRVAVNPCTGTGQNGGLTCTGSENCTMPANCNPKTVTLPVIGKVQLCNCSAQAPSCCFLYQEVSGGAFGVTGVCGTASNCPTGNFCERLGSGTSASPYQAACRQV